MGFFEIDPEGKSGYKFVFTQGEFAALRSQAVTSSAAEAAPAILCVPIRSKGLPGSKR